MKDYDGYDYVGGGGRVARLKEALAAAERDKNDWYRRWNEVAVIKIQLDADVARLTSERDEARKTLALVPVQFVYNGCFREAPEWFMRLRQAIDAGAVDDHLEYHRTEHPHALEAALRRVTDAESHCTALSQDRTELRAEVARLTEALAAAQASHEQTCGERHEAAKRAEAAEQKLSAVEAQCRRLGEDAQASRNELAAAERARIEERGRWEQKLAAANWLLESAAALLSAPEWLKKAVKVRLSNQPAAPDPKRKAESERAAAAELARRGERT